MGAGLNILEGVEKTDYRPAERVGRPVFEYQFPDFDW